MSPPPSRKGKGDVFSGRPLIESTREFGIGSSLRQGSFFHDENLIDSFLQEVKLMGGQNYDFVLQ